MLSARYRFGELAPVVDAEVARFVADDVAQRFWDRDSTVFGPDPDEIANRMGWFDAPGDSADIWPALEGFADEVKALATDVIVMGMGGSSLFPEVLSQTFGPAAGYPRLHVLDSTDADAVRRVIETTDPSSTFYLASSKSGTTLETRSQLDLFWSLSGDRERFGVVTDPDSALEALADERNFAHVFRNDPDIGGRFAALSLFGMVPAATLGLDGEALLDAAFDMLDALEPVDDDDAPNMGLVLAALVGGGAAHGREQLTIVLDERVAAFGLWLEQLIAESTGKHGTGIIPVIGESIEVIAATPQRRTIVTIGDVDGIETLRALDAPMVELGLEEPTDIGAHVVLWEYAVSLAGRVLGINPFDQPDVESAKKAARALMQSGAPAAPEEISLAEAIDRAQPGDTIALCAFVDPEGADATAAEALRVRLGREFGFVTTLGFGPRFLHSTGQLHKGGPADLFIWQFVRSAEELAVPGSTLGFEQIKAAQAAGDLEALHAAEQRAVRIRIEDLGA